MEDKMVVLRRFSQGSEANMLANLLQSEGIECYVRDNITQQIFGDFDFVSVKIELLEKDLLRAREIMQAYGYSHEDNYSDKTETDSLDDMETDDLVESSEMIDPAKEEETTESAWIAYQQAKAKRTRLLSIICVLIILLGTLIILLNQYYNG